MKVTLNRPCCIDGVNYAVGPHDISDELAGHWFVGALVADGDLKILEGPKAQDETPRLSPRSEGAKKAWATKRAKAAL